MLCLGVDIIEIWMFGCVCINNLMFEDNGSGRNFVADPSDGSWSQRATLHPAVENIREIWLCSTDALLGQRIN
jgi:hypothetical protein